MTFRGHRCGIGDHVIQGDPTFVTNPKHIAFIRMCQKEFRGEYEVCEKCLRSIEYAYKIKREKALQLRQKRHRTMMVSSTTNPSDSDQSIDSIDALVHREPRNPNLRKIVGATTRNRSERQTTPRSPGNTNAQTAAPTPSSAHTSTQRRTRDEPDDEYVPSPNATNGTRLPDVQPIIRRRIIQVNPDILNIYLSSITGG